MKIKFFKNLKQEQDIKDKGKGKSIVEISRFGR